MATYTLRFTEPELQALGNLLDGGVRHGGLATVHNASMLLAKIEAVRPDVEEPPAEGVEQDGHD